MRGPLGGSHQSQTGPGGPGRERGENRAEAGGATRLVGTRDSTPSPAVIGQGVVATANPPPASVSLSVNWVQDEHLPHQRGYGIKPTRGWSSSAADGALGLG